MGIPTSITPTVVLIFFLFVFLKFNGIVGGNSNISCIQSEREALLNFKQSLIDESNRLSSWVGDDCCAWHGVVCSNTSGHVLKLDLRNPNSIDLDDLSVDYEKNMKSFSKTCLRGEINISLLGVRHLNYLDLSMNNFSGIQIPEFLGFFKDLTYLNLSFSSFSGNIPRHLGKLSNLHYLDLSCFDSKLSSNTMGWASELSSLKHMSLSGVDLSTATDWLTTINMLSSLLIIKLADCGLPKFPHISHVNFTSLVSLDLSKNYLESTFPPWISNISGLMEFNLAWNDFKGPIPDSFGSLTSLSTLDLSGNSINTSLPSSLFKLTSLVHLDLSFNYFQGLIPREMGNLTKLTFLDLSGNQLKGDIPTSLERLSYLKELAAYNNGLSGRFPSWIGKLSRLEKLDVSGNQLTGIVPTSIGQLQRLRRLDLNFNFNIVMNFNTQWIPHFQLQFIHLGNCTVGPQFPPWLRTQRRVEQLNLFNTSISDIIPDWFENSFSRVYLLDLSYNNISGMLPVFKESVFLGDHTGRYLNLKSNKFWGSLTFFPYDIRLLDFSDNLISGHIPLDSNHSVTPQQMVTLILANNYLIGGIPEYLCDNIHTLEAIDLSHNQLSGRLPWCFGNLQKLKVLDVTNNSLFGPIPNSLGSLLNLKSLHLRKNKFYGKLPSSFQNLTNLVTLDLGENDITDVIPTWVGEKLSNLRDLILQSNKFHNAIPLQLCQLSKIQLLNLANNHIIGRIPPCFGNFTSMMSNHSASEYFDEYVESSIYSEKILESMAGTEFEYTKTLPFLTSIDLSNNFIVGDIPEELMNLYGLLNLNLARNQLKGRIPQNIGNLKQLESLDLSRNQLSGSIPLSLSNLYSLSHLNLSFNKLSGKIPSGSQLQTLDDPSIYMGNNELCGPPMKSCRHENDSSPIGHDEGEDNSSEFWLYFGTAIAPGFLVGFLGFCSTLRFIKSWRYAYFHFLDKVVEDSLVF